MISSPPGSDNPDDSRRWVENAAGEPPLTQATADSAARTYWDAEADAYQAEHGAFLAGAGAGVGVVDSAQEVGRIDYAAGEVGSGAGFVWGPEGLTEAEAELLGPRNDLGGQRALEVGAGAAQCSRWLAEHGVRAVGLDISVAQLRHAGGAVPVVAASGTALPFADGSFDIAFASYGAVQFVADLDALLAEVARVLVPGGRWVFSVTHPIRWAFPDDPGPEGLAASGSYFDRTPYLEYAPKNHVVYAEFHRTLGDYVQALRRARFSIETVVEPEWPDWNDRTWGGWSPLRGRQLPGTLIFGCRAVGGAD